MPITGSATAWTEDHAPQFPAGSHSSPSFATQSGHITWLAARLVALDRAANAQFEWASTCMAYTPPPVALREGRCVADE